MERTHSRSFPLCTETEPARLLDFCEEKGPNTQQPLMASLPEAARAGRAPSILTARHCIGQRMLKYGKGIFSTMRCEKDKKVYLTRESQIVRYCKHTWAN